MKIKKGSESGQALVLIMFAIFSLVSMAAAMTYDQNQNISSTDLASITLARAKANGYTGDGTRSKVSLTILPTSATDCPTGSTGYIFQVDIESNMPTYFGGIIGIRTVKSTATSKALGCAPYNDNMYLGHAIVSLDPKACQAINVSNATTLNITSTRKNGMYVFSDCDQSDSKHKAFYMSSDSKMTSPAIHVVGGANYTSGNFPSGSDVRTHESKIKTKYLWPDISDSECGVDARDDGHGTLSPGVYPGKSSKWHSDTFPPSGINHLKAGIYCIDNGINLDSNSNIDGADISLVVRHGSVNISSSATFNLTADNAPLYPGLLIYVPESNSSNSISVGSNSASSLSGSVLAPYCNVTINTNKNYKNGKFKTQVIANTIYFTGGGSLDMSFDDTSQFKPPVAATVQLLK